MRLPFRRKPRAKPETIRAPYAPDPNARKARRGRFWLTVLVSFFCFVQGFAFALFAPYLIVPFAVPIGVLALLVIWALPDTTGVPARTIEILFFAAIVVLILWPNYLAITLPGLPWITLQRLTNIPLMVVLLLGVSTSPRFRSEIAKPLNAVPAIWLIYVVFLVIQVGTIGFSSQPIYSLNRLFVNPLNCTIMFFAACYVFVRPGRAVLFVATLWACSLIVCMIALWEARLGHVPWRDHIPSFLAVQDEYVAKILAGGSRAWSGQYRVQSIFSISLGLAEFLALSTPFLLQFVVGKYNVWLRAAALATVMLYLWVIILTDSRLGVVGWGLTIILYPIYIAAMRWRQSKDSLFAPATVLAYPVFFLMAIASTFFIGRIRARVWGDGPQAASTEARKEQWRMGIPKLLHKPWGVGNNMGADYLGWSSPSGQLSIDSYYLTVGLEYGIIGFVVYFSLLLVAMYYAVRSALQDISNDRDLKFLMPSAIALVNFFVIKSVFSQEDNHPLVFAMIGMVVALVYRTALQKSAARVSVEGAPAPRTPPGLSYPQPARLSLRP